VTGVYTYGGVRPGNSAYQNAWNRKFKTITYNWWNRLVRPPSNPL
jgi:hypothetical protein